MIRTYSYAKFTSNTIGYGFMILFLNLKQKNGNQITGKLNELFSKNKKISIATV
jgi:hypothetical protein